MTAAQPSPTYPDLPRPQSMVRAVRLMRVAAGVTLLGVLVGLLVNGLPQGGLAFSLIGAAMATTLWMWMADATGAGASWARLVCVFLFAMNVLFVVISMFSPVPLSSRIFSLAQLVLGALCLALLWSDESTEWFRRKDTPVR